MWVQLGTEGRRGKVRGSSGLQQERDKSLRTSLDGSPGLTFHLELMGVVLYFQDEPVEVDLEHLLQPGHLLLTEVALGPGLQENRPACVAVPALKL